nr:minor capsid protein [uncultured Acetatifactor sp.]
MVNEYTGILKEELEAEFPALKEVYKRERDAEVQGRREDSETDFLLSVSQIFAAIKNKIISKTTGFGLRRRLESLAHINRKLTVKEWKRAIKATLGIDIREDYYLGDFYIEHLAKWVSENVDLITSIPEDTLDKMKDIVLDGFNRGRRTTDIAKDIQLAYGVSRKKARFIARDQTAKLNGQIQRAQQMDAGIKEYIWSDSGDERVRSSHRRLNGQKFSWEGDGPETDNGRCCHPGQDFNCRCIARPVFNRNINLPVVGDAEAKITVKKSLEGQSGILSKEGGMERMKDVAEHMGDLSSYSEHFVTADPEWKKAKYSGAFYDEIGYNNLPKVVSEADFEKIDSSFPIQYRGVQSRQQVEDFMFGKRYIGGGANGTGTNVSSDLGTAKSYAE